MKTVSIKLNQAQRDLLATYRRENHVRTVTGTHENHVEARKLAFAKIQAGQPIILVSVVSQKTTEDIWRVRVEFLPDQHPFNELPTV